MILKDKNNYIKSSWMQSIFFKLFYIIDMNLQMQVANVILFIKS